MGGSCSCERNCGDGGTVRQGSRLFQKKKTMSDTSVSTRTDKLKDESSSIRYTTQFMVPGQEGDEGLQEISSGTYTLEGYRKFVHVDTTCCCCR